MPDWVTHLGTTYIAARTVVTVHPALTNRLSVRHLLLGAILPDVTRFTIILVDILDWPAIPVFTYFIPFHSLLIISLLAGAISLLCPVGGQASGRAFGLMMAGAIFHFILDEFDGLIGCGSTIFYPLSFSKLFNGWDDEGHFATLLLLVSALALGVALTHRRQWPRLTFCLTRWRLGGAVALGLIACLLPLFFQGWMIERNAYYLGFVTDPAAYEGQSVELCFSEVISTSPLTIEEFDRPFVLEDTRSLNQGDWLSVRGVYRQGMIQPTALVVHRSFSDLTVSLVAVVAFTFLLIDLETIRRLARAIRAKSGT
ncbi:MAG: metal-dependent hydrolase [Anaerolineae bacterium]|nr:metal-dependent hydrolase [Anaerolineae bacterium]